MHSFCVREEICNNMGRFIVIGIDDNPKSVERNLSQVVDKIAGAALYTGGKRHYTLVKEYLAEDAAWLDICVPLEPLFSKYDKALKTGNVVVFASGDPLFFGFANTLKRKMPYAQMEVFPAFNSLQTLAHRLVMPYDDMHVVSLTGRPWHKFDEALIERKTKIGILTDKVHTPAAIASRAIKYGFSNYRTYVGEALGGEREKIYNLTLEEAALFEPDGFVMPNCLIMERMDGCGIYKENHSRRFGIPQQEFALLNGRANMITKMPVRLLSLSMLGLYGKTSLWDVGFCTGSVSVEAKMQFPHLYVNSFEIRGECASIMEENCIKFGVPGIVSHIGDFTAFNFDLMLKSGELLKPDAVFIGGHGGKLNEIMYIISKYLLPQGIVVFNSVNDVSPFETAARKNGFKIVEKVEITIDNYNKITCCKACKDR